MGNGERCFQTQFWRLNTRSPSSDNVNFWTKIDSRSDDKINGKLHMNSKFFCGKFNYGFEDDSEINLAVFNFEDLTKVTVKNTGIRGLAKHFFDEKLEQGMSNKFAIYNRYSKILKVYDFDNENTSCDFQIDFSTHFGNDEYKLTLASFFMGKIMMVKTFFDTNEQSNFLSFVIVNEDGNVIDGNKQEYEQYEDYFDGDATYHVDINGVLAFTNEHDPYETFQRIHHYY